MFIAVALALFDEQAGLNSPALAGTEVTPLVHVARGQAVTRQPHVLGLVIDNLAAVGVDFLPTFFAADDMDAETFALVVVAIVDVVDPPELLLATPPGLAFGWLPLARLEFVSVPFGKADTVDPAQLEALSMELAKHIKSEQDIAALSRQLLKLTVERALQVEMEEHLGYAKHAQEGHGSGNSRNGYSNKTLKGDMGQPAAKSTRKSAYPGREPKQRRPQSASRPGGNVRGFQSCGCGVFGEQADPSPACHLHFCIEAESPDWERLASELYHLHQSRL